MIPAGTLFEYLDSYSKLSFRYGRFQIVKRLRPSSQRSSKFDLYETVELLTGDLRNYDEAQIKNCSRRLPVAVSQIWHSLSGGKTFTLSRCWETAGNWLWDYTDEDGAKGYLSEATLVQNYARVDGLTRPIISEPNDRCPSCSHPAFVLARSVECSNRQCRFFVASA